MFEALLELPCRTHHPRAHSRAGLRYRSDLTPGEWAVLEPQPPPRPCGRHHRWPMREKVKAISDVLRSGCSWRMLPKCFLPASTIYRWFAELRDSGAWVALNDQMVRADRVRSGRKPVFAAAVLDSQTVRTSEAGDPHGYDAGEKVKGRKR